jgi:hypothetical protein
MPVVLDASYLMEFLENSEMKNFQWTREKELIVPCLLRHKYNSVFLYKLQNDRKTGQFFFHPVLWDNHRLMVEKKKMAKSVVGKGEKGIRPFAKGKISQDELWN